jgi:hypothetical protein
MRINMRIAEFARITLTALGAMSYPTIALGSVWQSNDWALTSVDEAGFGYDSNLYARNGGTGDGYAELAPSLLLQRLRSYTYLEVTFGVKSTEYFTRSDLDSVDPSLELELRYPYDEFVFPTQQFDLQASRTTIVDGDIGARLRAQNLSARWEGNIVSSEKTILQGRAEVSQTDYLTEGFSDNEFVTAGVTAAYVASELLELGAGYDYEYGLSQPKGSSNTSTYLDQSLLSLRGKGDFLPKVSGFVSVGVADTTYWGAVSRSNLDIEGDLGIVWQATERGKFTLKASRQSFFSPDGNAFLSTSFGPEWAEEFGAGCVATVGLDIQQTLNRFTVGTRTDHAYGGHFGLNYSLNDRYSTALTFHYITQDSLVLIYNYDRTTVYANFTAKF